MRLGIGSLPDPSAHAGFFLAFAYSPSCPLAFRPSGLPALYRLMRVEAPAKLNLFLQVLGRRPDGFHDVVSMIVPVGGISDHLDFEPLDNGDLRLEGDLSGLPREENLVFRAARALQEASGTRQGARIGIQKRIPAGGGLGGGSSDAAAVLKTLNGLWNLDFPLNRLLEIGRRIGSDIPFFLHGRAGIVRGTGERFDPLPGRLPLPENLAVVVPPVPCPTPAVYQTWDRLTPAPSAEDPRLADFLDGRGPLPLRNDLEAAAYVLHPELAGVRRQIEESGASRVAMSGSGSCFWADYPTPEKRADGLGPLTKVLKSYIVSRVQDPLG